MAEIKLTARSIDLECPLCHGKTVLANTNCKLCYAYANTAGIGIGQTDLQYVIDYLFKLLNPTEDK